MNDALIANINSTVKEDDTLWILGDVSLNPAAVKHNVPRINCKNLLLLGGNHDRIFSMKEKWINLYKEWGFTEIYKEPVVRWFNGKQFTMSHHPIFPSKGITLCGHVHTSWKLKEKNLNVGVDQWDYFPVSLDEILELINESN